MSRYLDATQLVALYDALDAGMTQREVAKRLGCSVSTVNSHYQRRKRGDYDAPDDAVEAEDGGDPNRVLDWSNVIDRCDAAWRLCRLTNSPDERYELLAAALWPERKA